MSVSVSDRMSVEQIVIELETPGDSRSLFRLRLDNKVVGENLTAVWSSPSCRRNSRPHHTASAIGEGLRGRLGHGDFASRSRALPVPTFVHPAPQRYCKSHPARDLIAIALEEAGAERSFPMRVSRLVEAITLVRSVSNSFPSRSPSAGPSRHCGRPPTLRTAFRVGPGPFRPGDINQFLESKSA
jgi:hypothetical protein